MGDGGDEDGELGGRGERRKEDASLVARTGAMNGQASSNSSSDMATTSCCDDIRLQRCCVNLQRRSRVADT